MKFIDTIFNAKRADENSFSTFLLLAMMKIIFSFIGGKILLFSELNTVGENHAVDVACHD